jgi:tetratricopeptide (TPR) repeat protein
LRLFVVLIAAGAMAASSATGAAAGERRDTRQQTAGTRQKASAVTVAAARGEGSAESRRDTREARRYFKEGTKRQRAGDIEGAVESFRAACEADPAYPQALLGLGKAYQELFEREMRRYAEAVDAYDRLTALLLATPQDSWDHELFQVYFHQGLLFLKGGEFERAARSLDKFLSLSPDDLRAADANNALGIAQYYLNQYDLAVGHFKKALDLDPGNSAARFNLRSVFTRLSAYNEAQVYFRAKDYARALARLNQLKEYAPRYIPGRRLEGTILVRTGRVEEGLRVYREILSIYPDHPLSYWVRIETAREMVALERFDEAQELLMDNLARFPNVEDEQARREMTALLVRIGGRR